MKIYANLGYQNFSYYVCHQQSNYACMNFLPVVQFFLKQWINKQPRTTKGHTSSLHILKTFLIDIKENFLHETFVKFNGMICIEFENLQNRYISKNLLKIYLQASRSSKLYTKQNLQIYWIQRSLKSLN